MRCQCIRIPGLVSAFGAKLLAQRSLHPRYLLALRALFTVLWSLSLSSNFSLLALFLWERLEGVAYTLYLAVDRTLAPRPRPGETHMTNESKGYELKKQIQAGSL